MNDQLLKTNAGKESVRGQLLFYVLMTLLLITVCLSFLLGISYAKWENMRCTLYQKDATMESEFLAQKNYDLFFQNYKTDEKHLSIINQELAALSNSKLKDGRYFFLYYFSNMQKLIILKELNHQEEYERLFQEMVDFTGETPLTVNKMLTSISLINSILFEKTKQVIVNEE